MTHAKKLTPTKGVWKWYWRQSPDGKTDCGVFAEPREGQAYSVCRAPDFQTEVQWKADAPLLSAAPDLLAACVLAMKAWNYGSPAEYKKAFTAIDAAIAKAEGKL